MEKTAAWSYFGLPPSGFPAPPFAQTSLHVVPAAQSSLFVPLHSTWQAAAAPHWMVQVELPVQASVQPPPGHWTSQLLLPPQFNVEPAPTVVAQSLPPVHVTVLLVPVVRLHLLVP